MLYIWSSSTYLDDDDKRGSEERRVHGRVQDRRTRLEGLKEATKIPTKRKVVAEKDLLDITSYRKGFILKNMAYARDWRLQR